MDGWMFVNKLPTMKRFARKGGWVVVVGGGGARLICPRSHANRRERHRTQSPTFPRSNQVKKKKKRLRWQTVDAVGRILLSSVDGSFLPVSIPKIPQTLQMPPHRQRTGTDLSWVPTEIDPFQTVQRIVGTTPKKEGVEPLAFLIVDSSPFTSAAFSPYHSLDSRGSGEKFILFACHNNAWLFPRLPGFGENVRQFISQPALLIYFLK